MKLMSLKLNFTYAMWNFAFEDIRFVKHFTHTHTPWNQILLTRCNRLRPPFRRLVDWLVGFYSSVPFKILNLLLFVIINIVWLLCKMNSCTSTDVWNWLLQWNGKRRGHILNILVSICIFRERKNEKQFAWARCIAQETHKTHSSHTHTPCTRQCNNYCY